jgi:hypothetical protein
VTNRKLTPQSDGGLGFVDAGSTEFEGYIDGANIAAGTQTDATYSLALNSSDEPIKVPYLKPGISCISLFISGVPAQTTGSSFRFKIQVANLGDDVTVKRVVLDAGVYTGLSGSTTIRVSDKVYLDGAASNIDCSLTNASAETDRTNTATGTVAIDTTTEYLYVHVHAVGDHADINILVFVEGENS